MVSTVTSELEGFDSKVGKGFSVWDLYVFPILNSIVGLYLEGCYANSKRQKFDCAFDYNT